MLMLIVIVIFLSVGGIAAARTKDAESTCIALLLALAGCAVIILIGGPTIDAQRDPEGGWEVVDERTYVLAEGSMIDAVGADINIVTAIDGELKPITIEDITKIQFDADSTRTSVVVQEEYRDVGTAIFWWGEGQTRNVAVVR